MSPFSNTTVVLVHGAFSENSIWTGVIERLTRNGVRACAASNPLRGVSADARYVADLVRSIDGPVVLVGHSYGGFVTTEATPFLDNVEALVYVSAFAPDTGESVAQLTDLHPGSTLDASVVETPLSSGDVDIRIGSEHFRRQFCADVDDSTAVTLAATQRAISRRAMNEALTASTPGWRRLPSWFVYGTADRNIPEPTLAFFAERARSRGTARVDGASHAVALSQPEAVAQSIFLAIAR